MFGNGRRGVLMYPVSEAFLQAVQGNTRKYYWTGKITTAGGVEYLFDQEDIVKGSGYITAQCCGNSEIELGAVYAIPWKKPRSILRTSARH